MVSDYSSRKITVNHNLHTHTLVEKWPINGGEMPDEPERVTVEHNNVSYSLVLDGPLPRVEVWTVNKEGEIGKLKYSLPLPRILPRA